MDFIKHFRHGVQTTLETVLKADQGGSCLHRESSGARGRSQRLPSSHKLASTLKPYKGQFYLHWLPTS
jgi:hypothetical protein